MHWNDKVIWNEGMFLQPQHFQQHDRYIEWLVEGRSRPILGHARGFFSLEVDDTALALGKIQLNAARGLMPDGTPFDFPGYDTPPLPLEVDSSTKDELIVLALPLRRPGNAEVNLDGGVPNALTRYIADAVEVNDTATEGGNSALIQVGRLNMRLMRTSDVTDAYCTIGVLQVTERRADNQLVLEKSYIPPLLHVGGTTTLQGYVREIHSLLHQRATVLAEGLGQVGRGGVAEVADFLLLQTVNKFEPVLAHLASEPLLHPERLFILLLGLAGDLATFTGTERRPPLLPAYQHDSLERCFNPLMFELRRSLSMVSEKLAIPIELHERKFGVRVAIIDQELLKSAGFVLAANAQVPSDTLRMRVPKQVKIGSGDRIRDLVNLQLPGIPLRPLAVVPRQIPFHAGFNYFELEKGGELWQQLEKSGNLAMQVAGEFPGLELEFWAIRG